VKGAIGAGELYWKAESGNLHKMNHPLQCRCGTVTGYVIRPGAANRAVCYCRDCQAFAHFLDRADTVLDVHGGTGIVATLPQHVHFNQGLEALACMSLSDHGMLRWYANCCNTPVGNTPRDLKTPYVGLIDSCLESRSASLQESFGPVRIVLNTKSAKGHVNSMPINNLVAMLGLMKSVIGARLNGTYKHNPFFDAESGAPVAHPRVLTKVERERVTNAA
jgi:hypothetical protein